MKKSNLINEDKSIQFKGTLYGSLTVEEVFSQLQKTPINSLDKLLKSFKGHFAFIYESQDYILTVVDKSRSFPIFYSITDSFEFSFSAQELVSSDYSLNKNQEKIFHQSGYTFGNETLIDDLSVLLAGEYLIYEKNNKQLTKKQYFSLLNHNYSREELSYYKVKLKEVLLNIFHDVINIANGREIIIPLSAGYDSRLVLSILFELGYKNIKTFSYGIRDNFESKVAKELANKLGYEWKFFETSTHRQQDFFNSQLHKDYISFCSDYCTTPFEQDVSVIEQIKKSSWVADDCIFINGNSGDFISGGHLLKSKGNIKSVDKQLLDSYIKKHCALWDNFSDKGHDPFFVEQLEGSLSKAAMKNNSLALILEQHEFENRQSKYVINGQRCYEFFGYDWLLPLWHDDIMEFFKEVPIEYKYEQHLYKSLLHEVNWGNVWHEIPVNKKEIKPSWLRPLRLMLKIFCAPFGKRFWHKVERKVFQYFMDLTRNFAVVSYWKNLFTKNIARSHVSWHSHLYLERVKAKTLK